MIAALEDNGVLHVIKWTGRVRLHAGVIAYCGLEADASNGVLQVPDNVFTSGASFKHDDKTLKACARCRLSAQAAIG